MGKESFSAKSFSPDSFMIRRQVYHTLPVGVYSTFKITGSGQFKRKASKPKGYTIKNGQFRRITRGRR